ncbi:MAG: hypothetical protein HYV07_19620 [Deltaproteobacteria bacterium]|nr:hypothetical protein [Deltaproteobacteria bacterium]
MISPLVLVLLAQDVPASGPSEATGGALSDLTAELTMVVEVEEDRVNVQETWTFHNTSGRAIADRLSIDLPSGARRLNLDEKITGWKGRDNFTGIDSTAPIPSGDTQLDAIYQLSAKGSAINVQRRIPIQLNAMRVIAEELPGIALTSSLKPARRKRDFNGIAYAIWDFSPISSGVSLDVRIAGLPSREGWSKLAALGACALTVLWAIFAVVTGKAPGAGREVLGPLSPRARRDRVIRAIELLEQDRREDKVTDKKYSRRHEELMQELASTLREIDLEDEAKRTAKAT